MMQDSYLAKITITGTALMTRDGEPVAIKLDTYVRQWCGGSRTVQMANKIKVVYDSQSLARALFCNGDSVEFIDGSSVTPVIGSASGCSWTPEKRLAFYENEVGFVDAITNEGDVVVHFPGRNFKGERTQTVSPCFLRKPNPFRVGVLVICDNRPHGDLLNSNEWTDEMHAAIGVVDSNAQTLCGKICVKIGSQVFLFKPEWLRVVSSEEAEIHATIKAAFGKLLLNATSITSISTLLGHLEEEAATRE